MADEQSPSNGRRDFLKTSTATAVAAAHLGVLGSAHAAGSDAIRVGLIGCGGRGTGAATNSMEADKGVRIVAMADVFADRLEGSKRGLKGQADKFAKGDQRENQFAVTDENCFLGFDSHQRLLDNVDVDYVILATPPHFRPAQLAAAIEKGRNVFMEKPGAVDAPGCRSVMASGELAGKKGLSIAAGTQRRHEQCYHEVYKRVLDGAIGKPVAARCYWNMSQLWFKPRQPGWSDLEWNIRDWVNWSWLSGDHICEQHVHNMDAVNWFLSPDGTAAHPIKAIGMGGRAQRVTGDQYDYFSIDFEYPEGLHVASYCRQVNGCDRNVSETVVGEKGETFTQSGLGEIRGANAYRFSGRKKKQTNPYVQEHIDLIASIREGKGLNEANNIATSTMCAVMGRTAAYTGKLVTWDDMMSDVTRLGPETYDLTVSLPGPEIPRAGRA